MSELGGTTNTGVPREARVGQVSPDKPTRLAKTDPWVVPRIDKASRTVTYDQELEPPPMSGIPVIVQAKVAPEVVDVVLGPQSRPYKNVVAGLARAMVEAETDQVRARRDPLVRTSLKALATDIGVLPGTPGWRSYLEDKAVNVSAVAAADLALGGIGLSQAILELLIWCRVIDPAAAIDFLERIRKTASTAGAMGRAAIFDAAADLVRNLEAEMQRDESEAQSRRRGQ